jgi:hypothetical protein
MECLQILPRSRPIPGPRASDQRGRADREQRGLAGMRTAGSKHRQYVWRDPESGQLLRVEVFGREEFFEDLLALGFRPGPREEALTESQDAGRGEAVMTAASEELEDEPPAAPRGRACARFLGWMGRGGFPVPSARAFASGR